MLATIMTASHIAKNVDWSLEFDFRVMDPIRKMTGQKTNAQLAAECLETLVDFDIIEERIRDQEEFARRWS